MDDVLEIRIIDSNEVYFRKKGIEKEESSQPKELERIIKELTDEDFEDYKGDRYERRLNNLKILKSLMYILNVMEWMMIKIIRRNTPVYVVKIVANI